MASKIGERRRITEKVCGESIDPGPKFRDARAIEEGVRYGFFGIMTVWAAWRVVRVMS